MREVLTVRDMAQKIGIKYDTLKTYLDGFKFAKFRIKTISSKKYNALGYVCNQEFWDTLISLLKLRHNDRLINNVYNYLDGKESK